MKPNGETYLNGEDNQRIWHPEALLPWRNWRLKQTNHGFPLVPIQWIPHKHNPLSSQFFKHQSWFEPLPYNETTAYKSLIEWDYWWDSNWSDTYNLLGQRAVPGLPSPALIERILSSISNASHLLWEELTFIFFIQRVGLIIKNPIPSENITTLWW